MYTFDPKKETFSNTKDTKVKVVLKVLEVDTTQSKIII